MTPSLRAAVACALAVTFTASVDATVLDPAWQESRFTTNRDAADDDAPKYHTGLAWAPDGSDRLFVLEQSGRVRLYKGGSSGGPGTWSTFATMSPILFNETETGLIGMAFDPDFANNHFVYFFVTVSATEQQIIRYDASGDVGTGRTIVLAGLPTGGAHHNGGGLAFGGDGKLYWAIGDGNRPDGLDNDLRSLLSKVGRAERDGTVPAGNPFDDGPGPNDDYIFARGMRNGFAMQVRPTTGTLWLGVAGQLFEQVFELRAGAHGGWNNYENDQPPPTATESYVEPTIAYATNGTLQRTITNATRSGNVATFTTTAPHKFRIGATVDIGGVADASFDGVGQVVASRPTVTTFTVSQARPDATSTGGLAIAPEVGGCVTGGVFYDATLAPAEYRGNYFFGDCIAGALHRVRFDPVSGNVAGISRFATDTAFQVDVATGPDGALYYTGTFTNDIYRAAYRATTPAIVVADQHVRVDEGGDAITTCALASAPSAPVTVTFARSSGDADVGVAAGASLVFTPDDWHVPRPVRFAAATDVDAVDDAATITATSAGMAAVDIAVTVLDVDADAAGTLFANGFE